MSKQGDIIAFRHETYGTMIKQVQAVSSDTNEIRVTGTQETSIDSRQFGPITKQAVLGKVIWHVKKPA